MDSLWLVEKGGIAKWSNHPFHPCCYHLQSIQWIALKMKMKMEMKIHHATGIGLKMSLQTARVARVAGNPKKRSCSPRSPARILGLLSMVTRTRMPSTAWWRDHHLKIRSLKNSYANPTTFIVTWSNHYVWIVYDCISVIRSFGGDCSSWRCLNSNGPGSIPPEVTRKSQFELTTMNQLHANFWRWRVLTYLYTSKTRIFLWSQLQSHVFQHNIKHQFLRCL